MQDLQIEQPLDFRFAKRAIRDQTRGMPNPSASKPSRLFCWQATHLVSSSNRRVFSHLVG